MVQRRNIDIRFEVSTVVTMKNAAFWDVALCRSYMNRRFRGTYRLHLQGRKIHEWGTSSHLLMLVPRLQMFLSWRWRRYVPPKRWFTQDLHGTTSRKTAFFKKNQLLSSLSNHKICKYLMVTAIVSSFCHSKWKNLKSDNENSFHRVFWLGFLIN
jgi:hypothetical protein